MNFRVLVYEYAEKGDLHEWLHGSAGRNQPLTWRKRMKIIQGVAKGFDESLLYAILTKLLYIVVD